MVAIRPGIAGLLALAGSLLQPNVGSPAPSGASTCKNVAEAVVAAARTMPAGGALSRLTPYIHPDSVGELAKRLSSEPTRPMDLWLAVGRTQDTSALVALRALRPSRQLEDRVGHALSLLALGDGSETGTITAALSSGPESLRERIVAQLATLWGVRPRDLLYPTLEDPSPSVRFIAAQHLSSWSTRARRTLQELSEGPDPVLRSRALEVLVERGQRMPLDRVLRLPPPLRSRALLREASRGNSLALRELRQDLKSGDQGVRTAALGALAALGVETADSLKRLAERSRLARDIEPELSAARLLLGDRAAQAELTAADPEGRDRVVMVLWWFTSSKLKTAVADPATLPSFLPITEEWLLESQLSEVSAARLLQALEVLDAESAVRISRRRILGPAGPTFERACQNLARGGQPADAEALLAAAKRLPDDESRSASLAAAARICAR